MGVDHFTFDPVTKGYMAHFAESAPPDEVEAARWVIAGYDKIVEQATTETIDGLTVVRFTLHQFRDPTAAMSRLSSKLEPRLRYTLESLEIICIRQRCGKHYDTRIRPAFCEGLMPPDLLTFTRDLTAGVMSQGMVQYQVQGDRDAILRLVTRICQTLRAFQQGATTVAFTNQPGPCPVCMARKARSN